MSVKGWEADGHLLRLEGTNHLHVTLANDQLKSAAHMLDRSDECFPNASLVRHNILQASAIRLKCTLRIFGFRILLYDSKRPVWARPCRIDRL